MKKYTEGPWKGEKNRGVTAANGKIVFETGCGCCTSSNLSEADARLIAAAPELLECLVWARDVYGVLHDRLSDLIEEGRLTADSIPDDYDWLVRMLSSWCTKVDGEAGELIKKATGQEAQEA